MQESNRSPAEIAALLREEKLRLDKQIEILQEQEIQSLVTLLWNCQAVFRALRAATNPMTPTGIIAATDPIWEKLQILDKRKKIIDINHVPNLEGENNAPIGTASARDSELHDAGSSADRKSGPESGC